MAGRAEGSHRWRTGPAITRRGVTAAAALAIFAVAMVGLHHLAADVSWAAVKADIAATSAARLAAAIGFTALSFVALSLYDVLAVETVAPGRVPRVVAALAGAGGYAVSNLLGFSWLTGGALRYRVYSSLGLDWAVVARLIGMSWVSFWLAIALLIAVLLVAGPAGLVSGLGAPRGCRQGARRRVAGRPDRRPGLARADAPLCRVSRFPAGSADGPGGARADGRRPLRRSRRGAGPLRAAARRPDPESLAVLRDLRFFNRHRHPEPGTRRYRGVRGDAGRGARRRGTSDVLAALALYRLIYYVAPFAVATVGIAAILAAARRRGASGQVRALHAIVKPLVPPLAAAVAFVAGAVLMVSGSLPGEEDRVAVLRGFMPLPFAEASHLIGSVAGVLLIVVAHGLYRKQRRAWVLAVALVATGLAASVLKGLDWEEAILLAVALGLLGAFGSAFYRDSGGSLLRPDWRWLLASGALVAASIWVGVFAYSHVPYRSELWWHFAWSGDAPRFLRASMVVAARLSDPHMPIWSELLLLVSGAMVIFVAYLRMIALRRRIASREELDDRAMAADGCSCS